MQTTKLELAANLSQWGRKKTYKNVPIAIRKTRRSLKAVSIPVTAEMQQNFLNSLKG